MLELVNSVIIIIVHVFFLYYNYFSKLILFNILAILISQFQIYLIIYLINKFVFSIYENYWLSKIFFSCLN